MLSLIYDSTNLVMHQSCSYKASRLVARYPEPYLSHRYPGLSTTLTMYYGHQLENGMDSQAPDRRSLHSAGVLTTWWASRNRSVDLVAAASSETCILGSSPLKTIRKRTTSATASPSSSSMYFYLQAWAVLFQFLQATTMEWLYGQTNDATSRKHESHLWRARLYRPHHHFGPS